MEEKKKTHKKEKREYDSQKCEIIDGEMEERRDRYRRVRRRNKLGKKAFGLVVNEYNE